MKFLSEKKAIGELEQIRAEFRSMIADFEQRAASCETCTTPGACCLDAHFVNVRVSRLEAKAIRNALSELPNELREKVERRIADTISIYKLDEVLDSSTATYACPLFEKGVGCLVHSTAKPLPCIAHACYSSPADLPPDEMLDVAEMKVERLNERVYASPQPLTLLPVAISGRSTKR
ncbi:MAG TPA: hypothetical protein PKA82_08280 [Pyrinomonadaceae bacterium]|nr:hypothetical protein [Pyrinomonadaceae bacterium]